MSLNKLILSEIQMAKATQTINRFPCQRRVTLELFSMTVYPGKLTRSGLLNKPLPKSSNVLSAGRNLNKHSAYKLIPSGVQWRNFCGLSRVLRGPGQKVTRHPFRIQPCRRHYEDLLKQSQQPLFCQGQDSTPASRKCFNRSSLHTVSRPGRAF